MDDLLCYSPTLEQHIQDVRKVFAIRVRRQEKYYVKASKREFRIRQLGFLGHWFSGQGVAVDPWKVAAVRDWSVPI